MIPRTKDQYDLKHYRRSLRRSGKRIPHTLNAHGRLTLDAFIAIRAFYHAAREHARAWAFAESNFSKDG